MCVCVRVHIQTSLSTTMLLDGSLYMLISTYMYAMYADACLPVCMCIYIYG